MIAITTINSTSVNPVSRRPGALPLRIRRSVKADGLALRMYVENVDPVGGQRVQPVAARPGGPFHLSRHRIARKAAQVFHFRTHRVADVVSLVQPFQLFGEPVLVRRVHLRAPHRRVVLHVELEPVNRRPDVPQRLAQLELLAALDPGLGDRDGDRGEHEEDRRAADQLDEREPALGAPPPRRKPEKGHGCTATGAVRKLAGRFCACGSFTAALVHPKPESPGFVAWNWNVASVPEPEIPSPPPRRDRPTTISPPPPESFARKTVFAPSLDRNGPCTAGGTNSKACLL